MSFNPAFTNGFWKYINTHFPSSNKDQSQIVLGTFVNPSYSPAYMIKIMEVWVRCIEKMMQLILESEAPDAKGKRNMLYNERGITYAEFYYLTIDPDDEKLFHTSPAYIYTKTFSKALRHKRFQHLEYTPESYKDFILDTSLEPVKYFKRRKEAGISVNDLLSHSYCIGKSRSGKSELLKMIIHQFIKYKDNNTSLLILDPHGELARELRRMKMVAENLSDVVYLDPTIDKSHTPVFNPFQTKYKEATGLAYSSDAILEAFQQLIQDQAVTGNMKHLLRHLIQLLLTTEDTTLMDLHVLLSAISRNRNKKEPTFRDQEKRLINLGRQSADPLMKRFFDFGWKEVDSRTISAVIDRVDRILSHPLVRNFVVGENSFDLEQYLNNGKVVIVNLDFTKLGNIGSEAIGRLIISETQNIAARRNRLNREQRPKTMIFIDECQRFVSSAIERALSEFAKFNTYLFLSHQHTGQLDDAMLNAMLSNTENKIVGRNSATTMGVLSKEINVNTEELLNIKKYQFHMKIGDKESILFKSYDWLLTQPDNLNYISEQRAKEYVDSYMIEHYYSQIKTKSKPKTLLDYSKLLGPKLNTEDFSVTLDSQDF